MDCLLKKDPRCLSSTWSMGHNVRNTASGEFIMAVRQPPMERAVISWGWDQRTLIDVYHVSGTLLGVIHTPH